jgi:hypothetical protein
MSSKIEKLAIELATLINDENTVKILTVLSKLIVAVREIQKDPAQNDKLRQLAIDQYQDEGTIEIDVDAIVSSSENGAYVAAWVWVDKI